MNKQLEQPEITTADDTDRKLLNQSFTYCNINTVGCLIRQYKIRLVKIRCFYSNKIHKNDK